MDLDTLITNLYEKEPAASSLEKTAAEAFVSHLQSVGQVAEENPYANLSTEELYKLAQAAESVEETESGDEDLEKVAFDMLGGQIMAHACTHELELIKEAVANGICRVCKENPMDISGSSICSSCQG